MPPDRSIRPVGWQTASLPDAGMRGVSPTFRPCLPSLMMRRAVSSSALAALGLFLLFPCHLAISADEPQNPASAQTPSADSAHRDSANLRDPFWPVGYRPKAVETVDTLSPAAAAAIAVVPWPALRVRTIVKGPTGNMAMVEDIGLVEPGQTIRMVKDDMAFRWKVGAISDKTVSFEKLDARRVK